MTLKSLIQTGLFLAALTAAGHPAAAQTSLPKPVYLDGTVICPDGTPRDAVGGVSGDLFMQLLCSPAMTAADLIRKSPSPGVQKAEADKQARAALEGRLGVWEALKATWEQRRLDYLQDVAMSNLRWVLYALLFVAWVLLPEPSRRGGR